MGSITKGLVWPVIALLIIGGTHLVSELVRPQLAAAFIAPTVMPIHLVAGAWAAWATRRAGGDIVSGIVAAAILGVLPVALQYVGFGVILGRPSDEVTTSALFGFLTIAWGGVLGSGYVSSRDAT